MVSLGGQFMVGFLVGALVGPWLIDMAKDIVGGVINMAQGAVGMQGQYTPELGVVSAGYSGYEKEDYY